MLFVALLILGLVPTVMCGQAPSCSSNFLTPSTEYNELVNICNVDETTGEIMPTSLLLPPLEPGYKILLVSPNYGCGNYPKQAFTCNVMFSTAVVPSQQRIPQKLVYASLKRRNRCNKGSDQLRLKSAVGGQGGQGKLIVCGKRTNLNVEATSAFSFVTFVSRKDNEDKGFELLVEGPQFCTTDDAVQNFLTPPSSYSDIFNLCALSRGTKFVLDSGDSYLLTSQDYGCYPYPHLEDDKCSLSVSHRDPTKRIVYTISLLDLRLGRQCNNFTDRLVFANVEDGDRSIGFRRSFCGFKKNVIVRARLGESKIIFKSGFRVKDESVGRGFEVLVQAE